MRRLVLAAGCLFALWIFVVLSIVLYHVLLATIRGSRTESCANCGTQDVRPSWQAGIVDTILDALHHYPYR